MVMKEIKSRFSVRKYLEKDIQEEVLKEVLEAGRLAPSACNFQPWKFIVVRNKENIKKLYFACKEQGFILEVPVVIVGCATKPAYMIGGSYSSEILDVGIALTQMTIQAVNSGLGTCWIGSFYEDEIKKILSIPKDIKIVALITLGYPFNPNPPPKARKPLEEIVSFEGWN